MTTQGNTILLVGNGSYLNRGCEAIVRGTASILQQTLGTGRFINSNFDSQCHAYLPDEYDPHIQHYPIPAIKRWSGAWIAGYALKKILGSRSASFYFHSLKSHLTQSRAALSIGGDNYSLDYGLPYHYVHLDKYIQRHNRPVIIWGASIGPFDAQPAFARMILRHLQRDVTAIFVRETISKAYLAQNGVKGHVYLMPDPAFLMQPEQVDINVLGFSIPSGAIGVNLSPILGRYSSTGNQNGWFTNAVNLLQSLCNNTDRPVVLIPHVTSPHSDDLRFLTTILEQIKTSRKDIYILPSTLSSPQTKWVISKLSCLIAARTHATIAGFSSGTPTISLAYSTKAFGINRDLFGHTNWVISPDQLTPEALLDVTQNALCQSHAIRNHLLGQLPQIQQRALDAGWILKDILDRHTSGKDISNASD